VRVILVGPVLRVAVIGTVMSLDVWAERPLRQSIVKSRVKKGLMRTL
jgi:hypothetical protein